MKCILHGHRPVVQEGKGKFEGAFSRFCADCGLVLETWGEDRTANPKEPDRVPVSR